MILRVSPNALSGTVEAPSSKSVMHRMLIAAALSDQDTRVRMREISEDIASTIRCLTALGARIDAADGVVRVTPIRRSPARPTLDCGESGSTLRFLMPVACARTDGAAFTGAGRLPDRPILPLVRALRARGVAFSADRLPFETRGYLTGGAFALPGDVSSQFVTGLLLALPGLDADSAITLTSELQSSSYVDLTVSALARFGVRVTREREAYCVPGGQRFVSPGVIDAEGDWSSAAFFLCAGAIGAPVTVTGVNLGSAQGDRAILSILRDFGANVTVGAGWVTVSPGMLQGITVDARETPDLLPILSVVAACAIGETRFINAARLRFKESDRITACARMITALGGRAAETEDGLTVHGCSLTGGVADSFRDHRVAMSAAIAATVCKEDVYIQNAEAASKSYPGFFNDFSRLGGVTHGV